MNDKGHAHNSHHWLNNTHNKKQTNKKKTENNSPSLLPKTDDVNNKKKVEDENKDENAKVVATVIGTRKNLKYALKTRDALGSNTLPSFLFHQHLPRAIRPSYHSEEFFLFDFLQKGERRRGVGKPGNKVSLLMCSRPSIIYVFLTAYLTCFFQTIGTSSYFLILLLFWYYFSVQS